MLEVVEQLRVHFGQGVEEGGSSFRCFHVNHLPKGVQFEPSRISMSCGSVEEVSDVYKKQKKTLQSRRLEDFWKMGLEAIVNLKTHQVMLELRLSTVEEPLRL